MDDSTSDSPHVPHVLIFPLPAQGHLVPMLKLAELLCLANLKVTFLNSTYNHQRLTRYTEIEARFSRYSGFRIESIPDGLPDDHPRTGGDLVKDLIKGVKSTAKPFLRKMLHGSTHVSRVTYLIVDALFSFVYDVANDFEVPVVAFRVIGASAVWVYFSIPKLIQAGEIPFKDGEDMDGPIHNIAGMDSFLRRRDLPSFCRVKDTSDSELQEFIFQTQQMCRAHGLTLNTFDELEGPILSYLKAHFHPKIYSIGPLHAHLKYRLDQAQQCQTFSNSCTSSMWDVDPNCISWLDQKPNKSVVYVSFGSLATITRDQFLELWAGLVQSKKYFLWAVRPNLIIGNDLDYGTSPIELLEGTKERGLMVGWVPQEEILAHRAVGGFLTQCGWNAVLEGLTVGVAMLCWPYFAEQQLNSRYISEVWRVGQHMKDICDRSSVEKMINGLMGGRRGELEKSTANISHLVKKSVAQGGSSYCNLDRLVEDIKSMPKKIHKVELEG